MNLKRYEAAADTLSEAIKRAPESKQPALRDLRRQCLLAESGSPAVANTPAPATTTSQAEIVLWKSIENGANLADFHSHLDQYPQNTQTSTRRLRTTPPSIGSLHRLRRPTQCTPELDPQTSDDRIRRFGPARRGTRGGSGVVESSAPEVFAAPIGRRRPLGI